MVAQRPVDWRPANLSTTQIRAVPNLVQLRPRGYLGECVKYNEILFIYLVIYLYLFFRERNYAIATAQTRWRIFTLDGSNDADSRKGVPFGGFVDIAPHFGSQIL